MQPWKLLAVTCAFVGTIVVANASVTSFPSTMAALVAIYNAVQTRQLSYSVTTVTLPANTDTVLLANATATPRSSICLMDTGAGAFNLDYDKAAVVNNGEFIGSGGAANTQGGSRCWEAWQVPSNALHGISAAGTTVAVTIGN